MTVVALYTATEARAPMTSVDETTAVAGRGLEGDRYLEGRGSFSRWPGDGRAVTLIEQEALDAIREECGIDLAGGRSRRNVVTRGVTLGELNGRLFRLGDAVLRGARLCAPCRHLERLAGPRTFEAMKGRGGLRANVERGGVVRVGDAIEPL